ncbi:MAG: heme NO-binding domain-containing protein [Candidatus Omnitrophota bacterium]
MKGVFIKCLSDLIHEKYSKNQWEEILIKCGINSETNFIVTQDIKDIEALGIIEVAREVLKLSAEELAELFAQYWINVFAPTMYSIYFQKARNAREFLLKMDEVHQRTTRNLPNAHPPRFEYKEIDKKTLIMKYKSYRGLMHFFVALVKAVGTYYKEELKVRQISGNKVEIIFS